METLTQLEENLTTLRMPYIRQHYQDQAKQAVAKGLGHVDYLQMLISGEACQRAQRATQRANRGQTNTYDYKSLLIISLLLLIFNIIHLQQKFLLNNSI